MNRVKAEGDTDLELGREPLKPIIGSVMGSGGTED